MFNIDYELSRMGFNPDGTYREQGSMYHAKQFPLKTSVYDEDIWVLAIARRMREENWPINSIPESCWTIRKHISDIEWLLQIDFNKFPYGTRPPNDDKTLQPAIAREFEAGINYYIKNHEMLLEDVAANIVHFACEYNDLTRETFNPSFADWFLKYFNDVYLNSPYCTAVKEAAFHYTLDIEASQKSIDLIWFNLWSYLAPSAGFSRFSLNSAWVFKSLEYLYEDSELEHGYPAHFMG